MDIDYVLIAIDQDQRFVLRLLNLEHHLTENQTLPYLHEDLKKVYIEYLMGSVILGSRYDDQEVALYKLILNNQLRLNCEVSPKGAFRSSIFPRESRDQFDGNLEGTLNVARLKKNKEVYQSLVETKGSSVNQLFQNYIKTSNQTDGFIWIHSDEINVAKNYAMWIERLPQTSDEDWEEIISIHQNHDLFFKAIQSTDDPDQIMNQILPYSFKILAVNKPFFHCGCSQEKVIDALRLLSPEELVEIFMEGHGIDTRCDYCEKIWKIKDSDIKEIVQASKLKH